MKTRRWGIRFDSCPDNFLVGTPWILSGELPSCVPRWPASYKTRREAREIAKTLTEQYMYLRPSHIWRFRAVSITIVVAEAKGGT